MKGGSFQGSESPSDRSFKRPLRQPNIPKTILAQKRYDV